jgi:DNA-binding transcriptional regulator YdaS (Cro superfamily)
MNLEDYLYISGVSITKLAEKLRITRQYLSMVVNGKYKCSSKLAKEIEVATDGCVSVEEARNPQAWSMFKRAREKFKKEGHESEEISARTRD